MAVVAPAQQARGMPVVMVTASVVLAEEAVLEQQVRMVREPVAVQVASVLVMT